MVYTDPAHILDARHNTPMCRRFHEVIPQTAALTDRSQGSQLFVKLSNQMVAEWAEHSNFQKLNTYLMFLCFCSHSLIEDLLQDRHIGQLRVIRGKVRTFCTDSDYFHKYFEELRRTECISELFDV